MRERIFNVLANLRLKSKPLPKNQSFFEAALVFGNHSGTYLRFSRSVDGRKALRR